jgi:spectinomycin phosphotransferase
MLEKPDLQEDVILERVGDEFGLHAARLTFLPLGYDLNTAVYRLEIGDGSAYFLKLRKGDFDQVAISVPQFLDSQGIRAIIAPRETRAGGCWGSLGEYKLILYPFIEGRNGYQVTLSDRQWLDFGAALGSIHRAALPPELKRMIPQETFSPEGRETVRQFQAQVEEGSFADLTAAKLAALMRAKRGEISQVVERAGQLAAALQVRLAEPVLCHSDIHPGNLLIAEDGGLPAVFGGIYIVDWDNPILAPKERDLALVGGCSAWSEARGEALFYKGYGPAQVDPTALAYYRYERIVQDMAAFGKQLLLTDEGGDDREQSYQYFASNFLPGHEIELADKVDTI